MVKDPASEDDGAYRHPLVVRNKASLCTGTTRQNIKGANNNNHKNKSSTTEVENWGGIVDTSVNPFFQATMRTSAEEQAPTEMKLGRSFGTTSIPHKYVQTNEDDDLLEFAIRANTFLESKKKPDT
jgi:hypothetical protein